MRELPDASIMKPTFASTEIAPAFAEAGLPLMWVRVVVWTHPLRPCLQSMRLVSNPTQTHSIVVPSGGCAAKALRNGSRRAGNGSTCIYPEIRSARPGPRYGDRRALWPEKIFRDRAPGKYSTVTMDRDRRTRRSAAKLREAGCGRMELDIQRWYFDAPGCRRDKVGGRIHAPSHGAAAGGGSDRVSGKPWFLSC